jgi:hypothetical protein
MSDSHMRARGDTFLRDRVEHPHGVDGAGVAALQDLRTLALIQDELDIRTPDAVIIALSYGASWAQIGDALGIGKQRAWDRYRAAVTKTRRT